MSLTPDQTALMAAIGQLLEPLARLAMSRGLPYQTLDELMRAALIAEARRLHADVPAHGLVSRISTTTGLSRREVTRLLQAPAASPSPQRWRAGEVFARWMADPACLNDGRPRPLPRQGPAPSFESLAQSVTTDVHPRALFDELRRLDLIDWNLDDDSVTLKRDAFVPRADLGRMLALMADNVGDHLRAAIENVQGHGDEHFEQAIYADELSPDSVRALRPLIAAQWAAIFGKLVPQLERMIAEDRDAGRPQDHRVRIGFYSFDAADTVDDIDAGARKPARTKPRSAARRPPRRRE
ncbi:MAG: DUF6502 family protein [Burkholderiaceae bacterium]